MAECVQSHAAPEECTNEERLQREINAKLYEISKLNEELWNIRESERKRKCIADWFCESIEKEKIMVTEYKKTAMTVDNMIEQLEELRQVCGRDAPICGFNEITRDYTPITYALNTGTGMVVLLSR
jgi:predicted RNase H-like nuclease (RuvC/YqgF family)